MDERYNLIIAKGENKTREIESCEYNYQIGKYCVKYCKGGIYYYDRDNLTWLNNPEILDPALYRISSNGKKLNNIQSISVFKGEEEHWHIVFVNGNSRTYSRSNIAIEK